MMKNRKRPLISSITPRNVLGFFSRYISKNSIIHMPSKARKIEVTSYEIFALRNQHHGRLKFESGSLR